MTNPLKIIGSKYLPNLAAIKQRLISFEFGGWLEEPQLILSESGGRCHYDRCHHKMEPEDIRLNLLHSDKYATQDKAESYAFHTNSIEDLMHDPRIPNLN